MGVETGSILNTACEVGIHGQGTRSGSVDGKLVRGNIPFGGILRKPI